MNMKNVAWRKTIDLETMAKCFKTSMAETNI